MMTPHDIAGQAAELERRRVLLQTLRRHLQGMNQALDRYLEVDASAGDGARQPEPPGASRSVRPSNGSEAPGSAGPLSGERALRGHEHEQPALRH